jgi:hypothetical protein
MVFVIDSMRFGCYSKRNAFDTFDPGKVRGETVEFNKYFGSLSTVPCKGDSVEGIALRINNTAAAS